MNAPIIITSAISMFRNSSIPSTNPNAAWVVKFKAV